MVYFRLFSLKWTHFIMVHYSLSFRHCGRAKFVNGGSISQTERILQSKIWTAISGKLFQMKLSPIQGPSLLLCIIHEFSAFCITSTLKVVDMRWGVRDEASDDHMTTSICLQEITKCQADSVGPNFVVRHSHLSPNACRDYWDSMIRS